VLLSERGHRGGELIGPLETFDAKSYEVSLITPMGQRPEALPPSMDAKYIDPPLGRSVSSEGIAEKTRQIYASPRLDKPCDRLSWFPDRSYMSSNNCLRNATAPNGEYVGNVSRVRSAIVDYPFITSRTTPDSYLCGEKVVEVLKQGLTRWGW
jgi:hypothetical protein